MSIAEAFWTAAGAPNSRLLPMERDECVAALESKGVGRIAYVTDDGPRVLPVNYILAEDAVIFRTAPDGDIYRNALETTCAFEVDEIDEFFETGWSVLVVGRLHLLADEDFARLRYGKIPEPWVAGSRTMFVKLPVLQVSGRRLIPGR